MKKLHLLFVIGCLACAVSTSASAQSLGLNFASEDPDAATSALNPTDVAGFFPARNWNNLTGATGTDVGSLVYNNNGTPVTTTTTVTWVSPNTWRAGANNAFPAGPNKVLTSGYIDTGNTTALGITLTVNNIPAAVRTPAYDVFVYFVTDSGADRGGGYTINDGTSPIRKFGSTMANPTGFIEDPGTDVNNSLDGTFLRFNGLTGASFTLVTDTTQTTPNGFRAPINAIQIVAWSGDANNDGSANIADYNIIRNNLEKPVAAYTNGDLDGNAFVDLNDFRRWTVVAPPAVVASVGVPEPTTLGLGAFAVIAGQWLRRRRAR